MSLLSLLLNKSAYFFKKKNVLSPNFWTVVYIYNNDLISNKSIIVDLDIQTTKHKTLQKQK